MRIGHSPAMPQLCGFSSVNANTAATPASIALPPALSTRIPISDASVVARRDDAVEAPG